MARTELRIALHGADPVAGLALDRERPPVRTTSWTVNGYSSVPVVWEKSLARPRVTG